jgi:hypothetical protein
MVSKSESEYNRFVDSKMVGSDALIVAICTDEDILHESDTVNVALRVPSSFGANEENCKISCVKVDFTNVPSTVLGSNDMTLFVG